MAASTKSDRELQVMPATAAVLILLWSRGGGWLGRRLPLGDESFIIGRDEADRGLEIPEDDRMSRRHTAITCVLEPGAAGKRTVWITDQKSKNGTFVNGKLVTERCRLLDGDILRIGNTLFMLRHEEAAQRDASVLELDGAAPAIRSVRYELELVAQEREPVLILGESGTGKERAARAIHAQSGRQGAFIAVNCASITESLAEGLLFGTERGAYTGAAATRGLFQAADGGTIFLDELGELPLSIQPKLLRAIQEKEVLPVGRTRPVPVDVRMIAATHRDLESAVENELFRLDLWSRLRFHVIKLPPLRQRREDIFPLLLPRLVRDGRPKELSVRLAEALLLHEWPMNVRELEQLASLLRSRATEEVLDLPLVAERLGHPPILESSTAQEAPRKGVKSARKWLSVELLTQLFTDCTGNVSEMSRRLDLSRRQTTRRLQQQGLLPASSDEETGGRKATSD